MPNKKTAKKKVDDVDVSDVNVESIKTQQTDSGKPTEKHNVDADIDADELPKHPSPEEEVKKLEDQLLRTMAEMQNLRRRTEKDIVDARKYAVSSMAQDLIAVLESLRLAEKSIPQEEEEKNELLKSIRKGVTLTSNELLKVFSKHGIERIDPIGEKFDHNYHQAMLEIPDDSCESGTIVQVMQAGYIIKDRLLRPALVGVSKPVEATS